MLHIFNRAVDNLSARALKGELLSLEPGSSWPVRVLNVVGMDIQPANPAGGPATDATYELEFQIDRRKRPLFLKFTHGEIKRLAQLGFRPRTFDLFQEALSHGTIPAGGLKLTIKPSSWPRPEADQARPKV